MSISASKVQARFRDLVVPRQINLTSGRRAKRLHQYPACGGRGSGGRDHSKLRLFGPWFSAVHPPGSASNRNVFLHREMEMIGAVLGAIAGYHARAEFGRQVDVVVGASPLINGCKCAVGTKECLRRRSNKRME